MNGNFNGSGRLRYKYVVFNVDNDIEEEALKTYITTNESNVIELSRLSNPEWNRQSYRIVIYYSEKEKIMSGEFWPQDIGVRPFMRRRGETKSNNQKQ